MKASSRPSLTMEKTGDPARRTLLTSRIGMDEKTPSSLKDWRVVSLNICLSGCCCEGMNNILVVISSDVEGVQGWNRLEGSEAS